MLTDEEYLKYAKHLWKTFVPKSGQADYVQGELIRAIEKLRIEAHENGNINWNEYHEILTRYISDILLESSVFSEIQKKEIEEDIEKIYNYEYPPTSDVPFNRLRNRIIDWYLQNKEPIVHEWNSDLDDLE